MAGPVFLESLHFFFSIRDSEESSGNDEKKEERAYILEMANFMGFERLLETDRNNWKQCESLQLIGFLQALMENHVLHVYAAPLPSPSF